VCYFVGLGIVIKDIKKKRASFFLQNGATLGLLLL
jgi:hypothetical protein